MNETFTSLTLQCRYRSGEATAKPLEFYSRVLPLCKNYSRAVGYFSSTSLIEISRGICSMICNGGKMRLITSPRLSAEDIDAIEKGYKSRDEIILQAITRSMLPSQNIDEENRLNILANMIESGFLDIKIAMTENPHDSMYHEKIGVFEDEEQNSIVITGSNNESATAQTKNFESFDVYCNWSQNDAERIAVRKNDFERMWNNEQVGLEVRHFPEFSKAFVEKYKTGAADFQNGAEKEKMEIQELCEKGNVESVENESNVPMMPNWLKLHDYQKEAIDNWQENNFRGIFDMATGTGKTLTALAALVRLYENSNKNFCAIILCPYVHLVTQWQEDIEAFNINPIIAFGASPQKDWKEKLERAVKKLNRKDENFFCLVTTIASFKKEFIQSQISKIKKDVLLIADEVHNLGAFGTQRFLSEKYKFRLALSATLERHLDKEGTKALYDFFENTCISYSLKQAITEKFLTPYKYHPIVVMLNAEERDEYINLTKEISRESRYDKNGKKYHTEMGKLLCIKRSRIVAGAASKISALLDEIKNYKDDNKILIYCGATSYSEDGENADDSNSTKDIKQIDEVIKQLYAHYKMKLTRFTAEIKPEQRELIKKQFAEGEKLQAIVAIKCLDEGVNIPSIKTAFILASSSNPKEYVQRRGRVLRLAERKEFAEIYDFITLPYEIDVALNKTFEENDSFQSLAARELKRLNEFASLALNKSDSFMLAQKIEHAFNITQNTKLEEFYE